MYCKVDTQKFKTFINTLNISTREVKVKVDSVMMTCGAVDASNVCGIRSEMYDVDDISEPSEFAIDLFRITPFLDKCKEDFIEIEIDDQLKLSTSKRKLNAPLISVDYVRRSLDNFPSIPFSVEIEVNYSEFDDAFKSVFDNDTQSFYIENLKNSIILIGGDKTSNVTYTLDCKIKDVDKDFDKTKPLRSKISTDFVKEILKATKGFDKFTIRFGRNVPLYFKVSNEYINAEYMIAPRIEPEDE